MIDYNVQDYSHIDDTTQDIRSYNHPRTGNPDKRSSTERNYRGIVNTAQFLCWVYRDGHLQRWQYETTGNIQMFLLGMFKFHIRGAKWEYTNEKHVMGYTISNLIWV